MAAIEEPTNITAGAAPEPEEDATATPNTTPIVVPRFNIRLKKKYGDLTYLEFPAVMNCRGATVMECFPDTGVTSSMVSGALQKVFDLELIGVGFHDGYPAVGVVVNGIPTPSIRVFGNEKIVIFTSVLDTHKKKAKIVRDTVKMMFDFCTRWESQSFITCEGIGADILGIDIEKVMRKPKMAQQTSEDIRNAHAGFDPTKVYYLTNSLGTAELLQNEGCQVLQRAMIAGVTGQVIQHMSLMTDLDMTLFIVPVDKELPDGWGAVSVGHLMNLIIPNFDFDISVLTEEAVNLEKRLYSTIFELASERKKQSQIPSHMNMYN